MSQPSPNSSRLLEVDALRGLAAMSVVLFHYTAQYAKLYPPSAPPALDIWWGHYGVNLFFIVSGFVIFMTLERTKRPLDFVVSRFSRLFPAYWVAVITTFAVTHLLGLPGKLVEPLQAVANLGMLHGLFGVPHVDNVYWTLEVELLFYAGMLLLFCLGWLPRLHGVLWGLLALRVSYHGAQDLAGLTLLPWRVYSLLILEHLPWFVLGICIHQLACGPAGAARRRALWLSTGAVAALALHPAWWLALLAAVLGGLVYLAAQGRLPWLRTPVLVWIGAVSYPLYLLHENIGWSVLRRLEAMGLDVNLGIALVTGLALLLAHLLHLAVELPAMRWIRMRYKQSAAR